MDKPSIGILAGGADWLGGYNYLANIVRTLHEYRQVSGSKFDIVVCADDAQAAEFGPAVMRLADRTVSVNPYQIPRNYWLNVEVCYRKGKIDSRAARMLSYARQHHLDYIFPSTESVPGAGGVTSLAWIPDFGHLTSLESNDPKERAARDERFNYIANEAQRILLSSQDSRNHFAQVYPAHIDKAYLYRFRTSIERQAENFCRDTVAQYCLPDRFAIVCNQLWKHKRHLDVIEAVAQLKRQSIEVTVVFTGPLSDYRSPQHLDDVLRAIHSSNVHQNIRILGRIPRNHQLALLQSSQFVIQPSECEGWNTGVEESRFLKKRLILSDINVHREQAYTGCALFPVGNVTALASTISEHWVSNSHNSEAVVSEDYAQLRHQAAQEFLTALGIST